jgi:hypothetical protein
MSGAVVAWIVAVVVVSGVALIAWWKLARPDVSDLTLASELRHAVARPVILAAALVRWSALNAVAEEFFFRGALQCTLTQSLGPALGIVVQAAVFGLIHYRGFPRGWSGIALATIYGLMLGALRRRARGLLLPWLSASSHLAGFCEHVVAGVTRRVTRAATLGQRMGGRPRASGIPLALVQEV